MYICMAFVYLLNFNTFFLLSFTLYMYFNLNMLVLTVQNFQQYDQKLSSLILQRERKWMNKQQIWQIGAIKNLIQSKGFYLLKVPA